MWAVIIRLGIEEHTFIARGKNAILQIRPFVSKPLPNAHSKPAISFHERFLLPRNEKRMTVFVATGKKWNVYRCSLPIRDTLPYPFIKSPQPPLPPSFPPHTPPPALPSCLPFELLAVIQNLSPLVILLHTPPRPETKRVLEHYEQEPTDKTPSPSRLQ